MLKHLGSTIAAALLLGALTWPAQAAPVMPKQPVQLAEAGKADVIQVRERRRGERRWRSRDRHYSGRRHRGSNFSFNFSVGTPHYYAPRYYAPPRVVYYSAPVAWTPSWYTYCKTKYRSFNPHTGRYMTYSGRWQLCH